MVDVIQKSGRFPDFKNKKTQQGLWIDGTSTPEWAKVKVAGMATDTMERSHFSWTALISKLVKEGKTRKALDLFQLMQKQGVSPNKYTFVAVLKACASLRALEQGRQIYAEALKTGCGSDVFIGSCIIDMYSKCGAMDNAWEVFEKMPSHDLVTWNVMIAGCVRNGQAEQAIHLFELMQKEKVQPDRVSFLSVVQACSCIGDLQKARYFHQKIIQYGLDSDMFVANCLVDMYAKCGSTEDAFNTFSRIPCRDAVSWNAMITGYAKSGEGQEALHLFYQMQREGVMPERVSFVGALNACASVNALEEGRHIHVQVCQSHHRSDIRVGNCLINMYVKCGSMEDACQVLSNMRTLDVVSWSTLVVGYSRCGEGEKALTLFRHMQKEGMKPDKVAYIGALSACTNARMLEEGRYVHSSLLESDCDMDMSLSNCLVDMYTKCGSIEDAHKIFESMSDRDLVCWNAMILGYVKCGKASKAIELFQQMQEDGIQPNSITFVGIINACASVIALAEGTRAHKMVIQAGLEADMFVGNALVDMYTKCGRIEDACRVFNSMSTHDVVTWNVMIAGNVKSGRSKIALELFSEMQRKDIQPNGVTFLAVFSACTSLAALETGRQIHVQASQCGCESEINVSNCLIDMYSKCGSILDAWKVFNNMQVRNAITWSAMLGGFAMHGLGTRALHLFYWMCEEGAEMDGTTFICLLSACSHAGLLYEGNYYLESMNAVYAIPVTLRHYSCMVHLLGHSGYVNEAEHLVKTMPCQPDVSVFTALLGACKMYGELAIGEQVANQILGLDPKNASAYVLLSSIYAASGN